MGSKLCAKMLSELCVLCERKTFTKYVSSPIGVTSHITPLAIRRGAGGEASVFSVCRRPSVCSKCAPKTSVNSVCSVREKPPQRVVCVSSHRVGAFYFSQKNTEEQNTQHSTETLSQPITQNPTPIYSYSSTPNIQHPTPNRSLPPTFFPSFSCSFSIFFIIL